MVTNTDLQKEMISKIKEFLSALTDSNIYTVSFEYSSSENICEPDFSIRYNTESGEDFDDPKIKWDCVEWRWVGKYLILCTDIAPNYKVGTPFISIQPMVKQWIEGMGLHYLNRDEYYSLDEEYFDRYSMVEREFINVLIAIIKELHESGFVKEKFSREIPIIIFYHDDGYDADEIIKQNIEANGLPLVQEYVDFLREHGGH
ncbi:MAG: hypothetical protein LBD23_17020 [Oscillospiraceae bacterium]|nr:hypothetical protein [Oscillospiraceae bacterium]